MKTINSILHFILLICSNIYILIIINGLKTSFNHYLFKFFFKTAIKPIANRKIKALKLNPNKNLKEKNVGMLMEEEIIENEDPVLKNAVFEAMKVKLSFHK